MCQRVSGSKGLEIRSGIGGGLKGGHIDGFEFVDVKVELFKTGGVICFWQ